jgi:hypothetical protein
MVKEMPILFFSILERFTAVVCNEVEVMVGWVCG